MMSRIRPFCVSIAMIAAGLSLPAAAAIMDDTLPQHLSPGGFQWLADGDLSGPLYMIISIEKQMVHVYSGDTLVGMASISTGTKGHSTPKGEFPILQKRQWHRSNLYSNAPMPFMQRLTWDGIALHAGHNPGYPASHGCIRLPYAFAQKLFAVTQIGTLVRVTASELSPVLALDGLVLTDPGSAMVSFVPRTAAPVAVAKAGITPAPAAGSQPSARPVQRARLAEAALSPPRLAIDNEIFRPRLSNDRRRSSR